MKIRIFALAKELGIDAKQLIKYCAEAGVKVKSSSPLASVTDEDRERVVQYINEVRQKEKEQATSQAVVEPSPMRELTRRAGKVRTIRPMTPRGRVGRVRPRQPETSTGSGTATVQPKPAVGVEERPATEPVETTKPLAAETREKETVSEQTSPSTTSTLEPSPTQQTTIGELSPEITEEKTSVSTASTEKVEVAEETSQTLETERETKPPVSEAEVKETSTSDQKQETSTAVAEEEQVSSDQTQEKEKTSSTKETATQPASSQQPQPSTKPQQEEQQKEKPRTEPSEQDTFIPLVSGSERRLRDVRPRGSEGGGKARQKSRPRSILPHIATPPPSFKVQKKPKTKPKEQPVQKPDMKLTPELLEQQSPLAAHLKKHSEKKKKKAIDYDREEKENRRGGMGLLEARQQRREKRKQAKRLLEEVTETQVEPEKITPRRRKAKKTQPVELKTEAEVEVPTTVRSFCEAIGRPSKLVMQTLFKLGKMMTLNDIIDEETALEVALELGIDLKIKREKDIEEELEELLQQEDPPESLKPRPPIVTILGHVDHGKTSLLDRIRRTNVAAHEYGGITQRIAAYQVEYEGNKITFVDTPGHAAFGQMRARGANVTDIVVLVVAADDGVMPQTEECISHAKAAGVPIIVALNKIDLPDVNVDRVLSDLAAHDVMPQEWGGDVEVVRTSALTGQGIDELLETIVLTAELHELKANPDRPALGVCLESFRDDRRGPLAWVIVQKGTLRIGDVVLCGTAYGRVRAMYDDRDQELKEAGPSTPVIIAGLDDVPNAGDRFYVVGDIEKAREAAEQRKEKGRVAELAKRSRPRSLEEVLAAARGGEKQELTLILKADSPGSLEALRNEISKFEHPEVRVSIIHEGVGGVNESDVYLASASKAIIIAFQVVAEERARHLAEQEGVDIRRYLVIYEVTDEIKRLLEGMLEPEQVEVVTGRALVLRTFNISRVGRVAGCRVLNGTIERSNRVRVIRDQRVLNDYPIASLRREKDDVREVREGMECGIRLEGFDDVKEGDLLEAYRIEVRKRSLDV